MLYRIKQDQYLEFMQYLLHSILKTPSYSVWQFCHNNCIKTHFERPIISALMSFFVYFDGLVQDCSNPSALAMGLLQPCAKPSICFYWKLVECSSRALLRAHVLTEYIYREWLASEHYDVTVQMQGTILHKLFELIIHILWNFELIIHTKKNIPGHTFVPQRLAVVTREKNKPNKININGI